MDRDQFTEKLEKFIHRFVESCGDITTQSEGTSRLDLGIPFNKEFGDSIYIDIYPYGLPDDTKYMVADALQELVDNHPTLSDGVFIEPYSLDGRVEGVNLHLKTDEENSDPFRDLSSKYPQLMFSAMENQLENPTMTERIADNSCRVAEFNNAQKPIATAEVNSTPVLKVEPIKPT